MLVLSSVANREAHPSPRVLMCCERWVTDRSDQHCWRYPVVSLSLYWQFNRPPLVILLSRSIIINERRFPPLIRIFSSSRFITQFLHKFLMKNLIFPRFTHINLQQDHIQCDYQLLHPMELPTNVHLLEK